MALLRITPETNAERTFFMKKQVELAAKEAAERDARAEKVIWGNVIVNAGMGFVPVGINILTFIGANATATVALGHIYGYTLDRKQAGGLVKQMLMSVGMTYGVLGVLSAKLLAEILKVAGIATFGAATAVGLGLDGVLCGTLSYALGYTAMTYFKNSCQLDKKAMKDAMQSYFAEGQSKVKEAVATRTNTAR